MAAVFAQDELDKFIFEISRQPILYDVKNCSQRDMSLMKETIWVDIARKFKRDVKTCKAVWSSLKCSYMRYRKHGIPAKTNQRSALNEKLSFLKDIEHNTKSRPEIPRYPRKYKESANPIVLGMEHLLFQKNMQYMACFPQSSGNIRLKKIDFDDQEIQKEEAPEISHTINTTRSVINTEDDGLDDIPIIAKRRQLMQLKNQNDSQSSSMKIKIEKDEHQNDNSNLNENISPDCHQNEPSQLSSDLDENTAPDSHQNESTQPSRSSNPDFDASLIQIANDINKVLQTFIPSHQIQAKMELYSTLYKYEKMELETVNTSNSSKVAAECSNSENVDTNVQDMVEIKEEFIV